MDKTIKLLEKFLKDYTMEGACGFWVQPDEEGGTPSVYIVLDLDWIQSIQTKPDFVARRMRQRLKEDIKNWIGIDVPYVGSTAKKCNESNNLTEQISLELRRRLDLDRLKHVLDAIIDYEINTCSFDEVGEYVSEVCDMLKDVIIDNVKADTQLKKISPKDRDSLYYFLVDTFGEYLVNYYKKQCVKGLKESKKRIIVTESQYNRLFEQKKSKVEMFQDLINDKLEYIRGFCNKDLDAENYSGDVGFETCAELEIIDSIKVDEVNMMTGARTDMSGNMYDSTPSIYVKLTINYSSLRDRYDFDEITYDLKNILKNSTGKLPIVFDYRTNNINKIKE